MAAGHLYERDGDRVVPSDLTRGPWDPDAQHGGPVLALMAGAIQSLHAPEPMTLVRLTMDLLRPAPIRPLRLTTEVVRPGRRLDLSHAFLHEGDTEIARGSGLRLRVQDVAVPPSPAAEPPPPRRGLPVEWWDTATGGFHDRESPAAFHLDAVDIEMTEGNFAEPGPAMGWIRLRVPVVAGEQVSGVERAAAAADFVNGMSGYVSPFDYLFINPDTACYLARPPRGEWIGLRSESYGFPSGTGLAEGRLFDEHGLLGRAMQTLVFEPRQSSSQGEGPAVR